MKYRASIFGAVFFLALCAAIFTACNKDENDFASPQSGKTVTTTLTGLIVNTNNIPLGNAVITAYNRTGYTNDKGIFYIPDVVVPRERCVMRVEHNMYMTAYRAQIPNRGDVSYFKIVMMQPNIQMMFPSSTGATHTTSSGAHIQLPANGFVDADGNSYTGTVTARGRYLNPAEDKFSLKIPGGDLLALNASNQQRVLYSFGMMDLVLTGTGNIPLNLAPGYTATLGFPIDPSQQAIAPQQIPTWYFDESVGIWKEEGMAIRSGNTYNFTVTHFTTWNCDQPEITAYIKGAVRDCEGDPVSNAVVTINSMYSAITDNNGNYYAPVPSNMPLSVQVVAANNNGWVQNSQVELVPALAAQQLFTVPDLLVPCSAKISGTITGCNGTTGTGVVVASWNGGINYVYCQSGTFMLQVPPVTNLSVRYYNGFASVTQSITSGIAASIVNTGNTFLCDTSTAIAQNSFYIDGNGYQQQHIIIDTTWTYAGEPNGFHVNVNGTYLATGQSVAISLFLPDTLQQTYPFNNSSGANLELSIGNVTYQTGTPSQGSVTLDQWWPRARGVYSTTLYGPGNVPVIISYGRFDAASYY